MGQDVLIAAFHPAMRSLTLKVAVEELRHSGMPSSLLSPVCRGRCEPLRQRQRNARFSPMLRLLLGLWFLSLAALAHPAPRVDVVVGSAAPELERFAASELCSYLAKLFGIQSDPARDLAPQADALFLVGNLASNVHVRRAFPERTFPTASDQGIVLRKIAYKGSAGSLCTHRPQSHGP